MLLDIVILPPKLTRSKVGKKIQSVAKKYPHLYIVDNVTLIPHLSLFHLRVSKTKLKKLERVVEAIVQKYKPFRLKSVRFVRYSKDTVLHFRISKPAILTELNREIAEKCRKFRDGELFIWYKNSPFSKLDRLYIKKYGSYWSVERNFDPHLTMVRYKTPSDGAKMLKKMAKFRFNFSADTVALCEINKHGQVYKILKQFKLK
jgi:2'-5' RNA ligase